MYYLGIMDKLTKLHDNAPSRAQDISLQTTVVSFMVVTKMVDQLTYWHQPLAC